MITPSYGAIKGQVKVVEDYSWNGKAIPKTMSKGKVTFDEVIDTFYREKDKKKALEKFKEYYMETYPLKRNRKTD
jgi:DNA polymerase IIIc chi subunit